MALQTKDYSVSGKSQGGVTFTYILRVTQDSQDVQSNTSALTVQAILKQNVSSTQFAQWGTGVSCTLNGEQIFSDYRQRKSTGTAEQVYYTWEGTVAHADDGTLQLTVGGRLWQNAAASYTPPTLTITESADDAMTLSPIVRASGISAASANIGETAIIAISKKNDSFTHSVAYSFGALSGYVDADGNASEEEVIFSAASLGFKLPESFYGQIPDAPSGECTLTCYTYMDGELLDQPQSCSFTATAARSKCDPAVSGTVVDVNEATLALTGDENVLIQYHSAVLCTITAEAKNGASITQKRIAGTPVEGDTLQIPNVETGSFVFSATDSRGYSAQSSPVEKTVIDYVRLTNNATGARTDPTSGKAVLTVEGNCFAGSFGAADNVLTVSCSIDGADLVAAENVAVAEDHTYALTLELTGLDYTKSHSIQVTVSDALETVSKTVSIGKGIPVFNWGEDYFHFNVPASFKSGIADGLPELYPVGSIYLSVNDTDPGTLFGGKWEQLKDVFLLAAGDTYAPGTTGGEAEHTLTGEEMPAHSHTLQGVATRVAGNNWNGAVGTVSPTSTISLGSTGGGQAHNNMPPYLAVYAWKRTE